MESKYKKVSERPNEVHFEFVINSWRRDLSMFPQIYFPLGK